MPCSLDSRFYRHLLAAAIEKMDDPERDAKTLLSVLVEEREVLRDFKPFVAREDASPRLRLVQESLIFRPH